MRKFLLIAMLSASGLAHCQTEEELCRQAQTAMTDNNYPEAIKAAGRALTKNPEAPCRRTRIDAALKAEPSSAYYLMAISDIDHLMDKGDKSENTVRMWAEAETGLAKLHFENKNFPEAAKHYQKAKDAYTKAKGMSNSSSYDSQIANADNQIKQANAQKK
ncbi:tetratricopeptide repeat protein [Flavobacterium sp.]|uniref:tetratricopeptide repeat protein n=1 Tax=Flavobacterium sp. TaxID=239 RepID=UPI001223B7B4|nr:tetratricopeptide repeat protein [Flavobacterium sp.]RZJ72134.1 MAG: hypothetical protein EOO49_06690 [Flavobacterium sp.]